MKQRRERSIQVNNNLCGLPPELWLYIFSFLDYKTLLASGSTCRLWHLLSNFGLLWKHLCLKHGIISVNGSKHSTVNRTSPQSQAKNELEDIEFLNPEEDQDIELVHPNFKVEFFVHFKELRDQIKKDNYDGMWRAVENPLAGLVAPKSKTANSLESGEMQLGICEQCSREMNYWGSQANPLFAPNKNSSRSPGRARHSFHMLRSTLESSSADMIQHSLTAGCLYGNAFTLSFSETLSHSAPRFNGKHLSASLTSCSTTASPSASFSSSSIHRASISSPQAAITLHATQPLTMLNASQSLPQPSLAKYNKLSLESPQYFNESLSIKIASTKSPSKFNHKSEMCQFWSPYPLEVAKSISRFQPNAQSNLTAVIHGQTQASASNNASLNILSFWQEAGLQSEQRKKTSSESSSESEPKSRAYKRASYFY